LLAALDCIHAVDKDADSRGTGQRNRKGMEKAFITVTHRLALHKELFRSHAGLFSTHFLKIP